MEDKRVIYDSIVKKHNRIIEKMAEEKDQLVKYCDRLLREKFNWMEEKEKMKLEMSELKKSVRSIKSEKRILDLERKTLQRKLEDTLASAFDEKARNDELCQLIDVKKKEIVRLTNLNEKYSEDLRRREELNNSPNRYSANKIIPPVTPPRLHLSVTPSPTRRTSPLNNPFTPTKDIPCLRK